MEHPGKIWNIIECKCNQLLEHIVPRQALRWLWVLGHTAVAAYVFLTCLAGCIGYVLCIGLPVQKLCKEKIYDTDPAIVNPALEGKLVRLSGQLTTTHMACDPLTGIQAQEPWISRSINTPSRHIPVEILSKLQREATFYAPEWRLGAYCIRHYTPSYQLNSEKELTAEQLNFTQPKENWQITPPAPGESDITLTVPETRDTVTFRIYRNAAPVYIVARQCGNELLMDDPEASFSYYENRDISDFITLDSSAITCLIVGSLAHFGLLCLGLSCLRSAIWHATQGRNILRLPLWQVALPLVVISCCLTCGLFLLTDGNTSRTLGPGLFFLIAGLGCLAFLARTWLHAPTQRG